MSASTFSILCEILAPNTQALSELSKIAKTCANDLRLSRPLKTKERVSGKTRETSIILTIPFEAAIACDAAWKLASRIACYCPQASVSAQINGNQLA